MTENHLILIVFITGLAALFAVLAFIADKLETRSARRDPK